MSELLTQAMELADTYARCRAFSILEVGQAEAEKERDDARSALEAFLVEHLADGATVGAKPCPYCDAPPGHRHSFSCPQGRSNERRSAAGVAPCRARQIVPSEWVCDCNAPGAGCKPTGIRRHQLAPRAHGVKTCGEGQQ